MEGDRQPRIIKSGNLEMEIPPRPTLRKTLIVVAQGIAILAGLMLFSLVAALGGLPLDPP